MIHHLLNRICVLLLLLIILPVFAIAQVQPTVVTTGTAGEVTTTASVKAPESASSSIQEMIQQTTPKIPWSISMGKIIWSLVIVVFTFLIIKYVSAILEAIAERWVNLRLPIKRTVPFIRVLGWTFVIYFVIEGILAPPIETLVAITASAGIALGFASQDILKNIFGGIMILIDRPFHVGDRIQINDHYGEVIQIGLRTVRVVTPDDSVLSIPNSEVVNQTVSNSNSGEFNCQVVSEFFLPPGLDLVLLRKIAYRAAAVSRYVYLNKPIAVVFKNELSQGRSLLKMRLKAYVLDIRYEFSFASEMTELVLKELIRQKLVSAQELQTIQPVFQA